MYDACRLKKQLQELAAKEAAAAAAKEGGRRPRKGPVVTPLAAVAPPPAALASQKTLTASGLGEPMHGPVNMSVHVSVDVNVGFCVGVPVHVAVLVHTYTCGCRASGKCITFSSDSLGSPGIWLSSGTFWACGQLPSGQWGVRPWAQRGPSPGQIQLCPQ